MILWHKERRLKTLRQPDGLIRVQEVQLGIHELFKGLSSVFTNVASSNSSVTIILFGFRSN